MPPRCQIDPRFALLTEFQDGVVSREQSLHAGLTARSIAHRLSTGSWQDLLPGVYLTRRGEPTRRQLLIAALLYCGPHSAIDGIDACRYHGIRAVPLDDPRVFVVEPWGSPARSRDFLVVRRSVRPISTVATERLRYVDAATAVVSATRRMSRDRLVLAAMSDALQRRTITLPELVRAHVQNGQRGAGLGDAAIAALSDGVRSVPEADARLLFLSSTVLPPVEFNVWLVMPGGEVLCVDALVEDSAVVHETNGRSAHSREDRFEDMHARHDVLETAGFCVLHNTPRRLRVAGRVALLQVEQCHRRYAGRGLPAGVRRLSEAEVGAYLARIGSPGLIMAS